MIWLICVHPTIVPELTNALKIRKGSLQGENMGRGRGANKLEVYLPPPANREAPLPKEYTIEFKVYLWEQF